MISYSLAHIFSLWVILFDLYVEGQILSLSLKGYLSNGEINHDTVCV
jgi:hypothetical protein